MNIFGKKFVVNTWNNFISFKMYLYKIKNGKYDNGRIISADEIQIVLNRYRFKIYI